MNGSRQFVGLLTMAILVPGVAAADVVGPFRADVGAVGMGNTGIAVGGRGCLWTYNPALLNTFSFDLCIPNVDFGANAKAFELFDFLDDRKDDLENFDTLPGAEQADLLDDASEFYRKPLGFRTAPLVGLAMRNFGAAAYADTRGTVVVRPGRLVPTPYPPPVSGLFLTDLVAEVGTAGLAFDPLVLGITLRYVNRGFHYVEDIDPADLDDLLDTLSDDMVHFHGWGVDVGAYYPTGIWNLTLGANFRNILGKTQTPGPDPDDPEKDKGTDEFYRNLAVGAAWLPFPRLLLAADIEDLLNQVDDLDFGDQIHVGAELDMILIKVRTGMFRGNVTYGAGLNLLFFKIDFATFVPEFDRPDLTKEEQRVYIGQVRVGW